MGTRRKIADTDELELRSRLVDLDTLEQHGAMTMRAKMWRDGKLVEEEEHELQANSYFNTEVLMLLELTGLQDVRMFSGYPCMSPTPADGMLTYETRKA